MTTPLQNVYFYWEEDPAKSNFRLTHSLAGYRMAALEEYTELSGFFERRGFRENRK